MSKQQSEAARSVDRLLATGLDGELHKPSNFMCYDEMPGIYDEVIARWDPDLIIATSWNETNQHVTDGELRPRGTPQQLDETRAALDQALDTLGAGGADTVFLSVLPPGPAVACLDRDEVNQGTCVRPIERRGRSPRTTRSSPTSQQHATTCSESSTSPTRSAPTAPAHSSSTTSSCATTAGTSRPQPADASHPSSTTSSTRSASTSPPSTPPNHHHPPPPTDQDLHTSAGCAASITTTLPSLDVHNLIRGRNRRLVLLATAGTGAVLATIGSFWLRGAVLGIGMALLGMAIVVMLKLLLQLTTNVETTRSELTKVGDDTREFSESTVSRMEAHSRATEQGFQDLESRVVDLVAAAHRLDRQTDSDHERLGQLETEVRVALQPTRRHVHRRNRERRELALSPSLDGLRNPVGNGRPLDETPHESETNDPGSGGTIDSNG